MRAEVRKVWTTKLCWGMLMGSVAFAAIGVVSQIATNGVHDNPVPLLTLGATRYSSASSAADGALCVGSFSGPHT